MSMCWLSATRGLPRKECGLHMATLTYTCEILLKKEHEHNIQILIDKTKNEKKNKKNKTSCYPSTATCIHLYLEVAIFQRCERREK